MNAKEIAEAGLARALEVTDKVPSGRAVMYRRISHRQMQLFSKANQVDPDFYGTCSVGALGTSLALDLRLLVDPLYRIDRVTDVLISDAGTSGYATGDVVHIVHPSDPTNSFAPRATVRDHVVRSVGQDLLNVVSLQVFYSRLPAEINATTLTNEVDIPVQFQELLVLDLAQDLLRKSMQLDPKVKGPAIEMLQAEEAEMMEDYLGYVAGFVANRESRFGRHGAYP